MIRRTFQHIPGVGPWREKDLWARGVATWDDFPRAGSAVVLSAAQDDVARSRIEQAQEAMERRDLPALARLLPPREHWRLYREFADEAVFFDIETDGRERLQPTVVSLLDRDGIRVFLRDRNLEALPEALERRRLWVTFNGSVFDVPVLTRHFPELPVPAAHIDLRFVFRKLRLGAGLKALEDHFRMGRPPHLRGVGGSDAVLLWRTYQESGELEALRFLVEYNLYDAINLRTLVELGYNTWLDELNLADEPKVAVFERGDVLYDVSKLLLELGPTERDLRVLERIRGRDRQLLEE
ncbi:MAG TPA: ribonuclease H-like domain-containing protein [Myxococcaceae bacterium]|nr:ribonuclease H-like domain-containing protein [Myxococcaceae bacterium]